MQKLFGTDGIRGEVGKYPLSPDAVFTLGQTLGLWLKQRYHKKRKALKIIIGKDTRESGDGLEMALLKGARLHGLEVLRIGICPTPCVAYLTRALKAHLGLAISASHNPGSDNGIKFFDARGYKLFPSDEKELEQIFFNLELKKNGNKRKIAHVDGQFDYISLYSDFAKKLTDGMNLSKLKVVVDCAFGSFSKIGPRIFKELGIKLFTINNQPDGKNINVDCGTLYPQKMSEKVLEYGAHMGIAFDGDGDRVIVADEKGNILDGDHIIAILAQEMIKQKRLSSQAIVCTKMSNIGLELCLQQMGLQMIRTDVGDKYVLQEMLKNKVNLGGEQSGHIILLEHTTTGDGLIVALELIKVMVQTKKPLSSLSKKLKKFPQILVNIKVKEKRPFKLIPGLNETIQRYRAELGKQGRLYLRYSGTENLARIMVEASSDSLVNRIAASVAEVIEKAVGVDR